MAITTKPASSAGIPNSKTTIAATGIATPTSKTTVSSASVATPISKTTVSAASIATPVSKTTVSATAASIPISKTTVSAATIATPVSKATISSASIATPVSKTTVSAASIATPVSKTTIAASTASIPNAKTAIDAVGVPRNLIPLVSLDFKSGVYNQGGNPISFADLFTYTRDSSATFINRRVVDNNYEYFLDTDFVGSVTNLMFMSQNFVDSEWNKNGDTTLGKLHTAPDGTLTAQQVDNMALTTDDSGGNDNLRQNGNSNATGTGAANLSFYIKTVSGNLGQVKLRLRSSTENKEQIINIDGEFKRVEITLPVTISGQDYRSVLGADQSVIIWAGQITEGAKIKPYVKTVSGSVTDTFTESIRLEYDEATGDSLGYLPEAGSTNLVTQSEDFSNAQWTNGQSSEVLADIVAPDGTISAYNLIEDGSDDNHQIGDSTAHTSGSTYTFSVFAKAKERTIIELNFGSSRFPTGANAKFNLLTGAIFSEGAGIESASIKSVGNGWYRCSVTSICDSTGSQNNNIRLTDGATNSYTGDGVSGAYIWGAQIELDILTSYIFTNGSTVTRLADVLTLPNTGNVKDNHDLTTFVNFATNQNDDIDLQYAMQAETETGSGLYVSQNIADDKLRFKNGGSAFNSTVNIVAGVFYKATMVYSKSTNEVTGYSDGVQVLAPSDQGDLLDLVVGGDISIGSTSGSTAQLNGHIKTITIYDSALTASEVGLL